MPEISRFFGIVIKIFYDDHNPPRNPHDLDGPCAKMAWGYILCRKIT